MQREQRYIVIKLSDATRALDSAETEVLTGLRNKIAESRIANGKKPLMSIVVESDWPEYQPTWAAIEARVDGHAVPAQTNETHPSLSSLFLVSGRVSGDDEDIQHIVEAQDQADAEALYIEQMQSGSNGDDQPLVFVNRCIPLNKAIDTRLKALESN